MFNIYRRALLNICNSMEFECALQKRAEKIETELIDNVICIFAHKWMYANAIAIALERI